MLKTDNKNRKSWDDYFLSIAEIVSTRATCDRLHVGAVIVKDKTIISTGYNGSLPGGLHCDDAGHDIVDGHCIRTIHAERNAIYSAARKGVQLLDSTIYITHFPCFDCYKAIILSGISKIRYSEMYGNSDTVTKYHAQIGGAWSPTHRELIVRRSE